MDQRESISEKKHFQAQDSASCSHENFLQSNLSWLQRAFSSSTTLKERPTGDRSSLTSVGDVSQRFAHEVKVSEVVLPALDLLILL
jgi:hypothetical protein